MTEVTEQDSTRRRGDTVGFSVRAIAVITCVSSALLVARQNPPSFKTAVQTVAVYATVRDHDGHLVTDLTKDDFEIFDYGPLQAIHQKE
jgi:hypothetical protein